MIRIMPRPDGTLYQSEKDAIAKAEKAKAAQLEPAGIAVAAKRRGRPPGKKVEAVKIQGPKMDEALEVIADKVRAETGTPRFVMVKPGARLKASPEMIERVVGAIKSGLTIHKAAIISGVSPEAVAAWLNANRNLKQVFAAAELEFERSIASKMVQFAQDDAKAASWILERRCGWVPPAQRVEQSGTVHHLTIHKSLLGGIGKLNEPPPIEVQARKVS
jgi:hypothetical protein